MTRLKLFWMLAALLVLNFLVGCAHTRGPAPDGPLCFAWYDDNEKPIFECQYPDRTKKRFDFLDSNMICEPQPDHNKYLQWCGTCN